MYNTVMKIISTTEARKDISNIINQVRSENRVFGVGRRNKVEVLLVKYPDYHNPKLSEMTNLNANSNSFDWLADEPNLYSLADLKKKYV